MSDHERYETLCALAATGQLDALEDAELDRHRRGCAACRDQLRELSFIGARLQLDAALEAGATRMPAGSLERFRSRAVREGISTRSVPATTLASCVRASAAAFIVVAASLAFMLGGRKIAEPSGITPGAPSIMGQSLTASVDRRPLPARPAKVVRARLVRRSRVRPSGTGASGIAASGIAASGIVTSGIITNGKGLTAQPFPQVIAASRPYFGPQVATKANVAEYPALSGPEISRIALFRTLGDATTRDGAGDASQARPIDIASTGKVFDFAAQIRQLRFQLPTAQ